MSNTTGSDGAIFADQAPAAPKGEPPVAPETPREPAPKADPYQDLLKEIKTQDGRVKYATVSDALNALRPAQEHISTLEQENLTYKQKLEQLQADLEKAGNVDKLLEKLDRKQETGDPETAGITEQDVLRVLTERERKQAEKANAEAVVSALTEHFGAKDKAAEAFKNRGKDLGLDLDDLARRSPKAVLELFKLERKPEPTKTIGNQTPLRKDEPPRKRSMHEAKTTVEMLDIWRSHKPEQG